VAREIPISRAVALTLPWFAARTCLISVARCLGLIGIGEDGGGGGKDEAFPYVG
jgi:hypothetical protein